MKERDPIGFDPAAWVQRLRDVNDSSQFKPVEKIIIEHALRDLQTMLTMPHGD